MYNEDSIMNYADFNYIENKIVSLRNRIINLGYSVEIYNSKIWVKKDFLLYTYLNNIENGIENLSKGYYKPYGWQNKKIWTKGMSFSYKDVNRWLNNLDLIEAELNNHTENLKFNDNVYFNDTTIFG